MSAALAIRSATKSSRSRRVAMPMPFGDIPMLAQSGSVRGLREIRMDRLGMLRRFNRECGPIGRTAGFIGGKVVLVNSPALVHETLFEKARAFEKSPILRTALHPLTGFGLFTSEGELWRRQRKLMSPLFQPAELRSFPATMAESAVRTAETWSDGQVV